MNTLTAKQTFTRFGLYLLLACLASELVSLAVMLPLMAPGVLQKTVETVGPSAVFLLMYVPKFLMLLVFFLLVRKIPKCSWEKEQLRIGELAGIFVMTYAVSTVINLIGRGISAVSPAGGSQALDTIGSMAGSGVLMGFLIPALIGPVVEELIFRKLMIDRLRNYGERTAIVFTALCFGLFHGNLTQFLYAACVGLFLGYIYCRTGKVLHTMLIHILLNTFSCLIMLFVPLLGGEQKVLAILGIFLFGGLMIFMMITGFAQLIRHLKKKDLRRDGPVTAAVPRSEVFRTVYCNAGVILFFAYSIAAIGMSLFNIELPIDWSGLAF